MISFTQLAERFEKVLNRLPGPIRTPVEHEWRPLKELFIKRRPPRLLLVGTGVETILHDFFLPGEPEQIADGPGAEWKTIRHRGTVQVALAVPEGNAGRRAIAELSPDCIVFFSSGNEAERDFLRDLWEYDRQRHGGAVPLIVADSAPDALPWEATAVVPATRRDALLASIARSLPDEARLEFARVTGEKALQREIAESLTRSSTAICTAIGAQPIPLADLPVLTSIQVLTVAGIVHVAGREWSLKTGRDFLAAMGLNVGAAFLMREGARAAAKLLPGWGNAVSGAVAGAGTYAVGRAATAYFIDGLPLEEARRKLRLTGRKKPSKALPPPED